jgi:type II secretory pathway component GspD/PulD (secretin)
MHDGQTVMLSGIVRTEDFKDVRKIPLLGDLPGIGKVFRNVDAAKRNRELIAFITPIVVRSNKDDTEKAMAPYVNSLDRLKRVMEVPTTLPTTQPNQKDGKKTNRPAEE